MGLLYEVLIWNWYGWIDLRSIYWLLLSQNWREPNQQQKKKQLKKSQWFIPNQSPSSAFLTLHTEREIEKKRKHKIITVIVKLKYLFFQPNQLIANAIHSEKRLFLCLLWIHNSQLFILLNPIIITVSKYFLKRKLFVLFIIIKKTLKNYNNCH